MEMLILLIITLSSFGRAFDCSDIQDQVSCVSLSGCTWSTEKCEGSFLSYCQAPDCYYVDPLNGLDSQNGQISAPFKSLTLAFQKLSILSGNVTILNYGPQTEAEILNYTAINSSITVMPLLPNNGYTISLANFDILSLPTNQDSALTINSGILTLIGCTINDRTAREEFGSIFEIGNANLTFQHVNIDGYQGTIPLVAIAADKTTASFKYLGGKHRDSSFWFSLLAGTHRMKDLTIENNKAPDQLIYAGSTLNISNVVVNKGASLLLKLMENTSLNVSNVTVSNYTNGFISAVNPVVLNITLSNFQDVDLETSESLIDLQLVAKPNVSAKGAFWTKYTIFQNVKVTKSVIAVSTDDDNYILSYTYSILNVTMTNITKKDPINNMPSASDDTGSVCFWGQQLTLKFNTSTFMNINSHCISVEYGEAAGYWNVFDNSRLEVTSLASSDMTSDSQGVSWISLSCSNPYPLLMILSGFIGNTFIENKILTSSGGAIRLIGDCVSFIKIQNNNFTGNRALYGGAIYSNNPFCMLTLLNNVYTNNSAINGGAIYVENRKYRLPFIDLVPIQATQVILFNQYFESNTASNKGGAIYLDWQSLVLLNSTFSNSRAQYGGAIYFDSLNIMPNSFNKMYNNSFQSNTATISGSDIKLLFNFSLANQPLSQPKNFPYCTTISNSGCSFTIPINAIPFKNNIDPISISDSKPTAFQFSFYDILLPELTIAGNEDFDLWIDNRTRTRLSDTWNTLNFPQNFTIIHKAGHNLSQIILVEVIDQNNQLVDFIFNESVSISISASQNNITDFKASLVNSIETFTFNYGRLFMKSVEIVGQPNTTATLAIQTLEDTLSILEDANLYLNQNIQMYFQPCEIGDVYQPITHKCYTCPEGSYTLLDPNSSLTCLPCDNERAVCPGGFQIAPKPGFWRYGNTSDNILDCENEEACLGGLINDTYYAQGECAFPYQGNLCNGCAPGYAKFGSSSSCTNCTIDDLYYIKMVSFLLIQIVTVLYAVKSNVDRISDIRRSQIEDSPEIKEKIQNETFQSNLLKVGVNFIQSSTVIFTLQLEWPEFVNDIVGSTNKIFPSYKDGFSIDCIIALVKGNNQNLYFFHFAANLVQPFALWIIIILFYMLYLQVKAQPVFSNPKLKRTLFVMFLIIGFLLQPTIIQSSLSLFACRNLNSSKDPIYYMNEDTEVQCWTFQHMIWCLAVALPHLILWAVVLPLILLIKIRTHRKRLQDQEAMAKYSFVLQGLKNNRYYWEFVALLRKISLIVICTLFSFLSKKSQAFAVFFVISIFTFFQLKYQPYLDSKTNRAELLSLISLSSLAFCGIFFGRDTTSEELGKTFFIAVVCASNIMFFVYLTLHFARSYLKTMQKFLDKLDKVLSNNKEKKEKNVEGSIISADPVPCQSVEESQDKISSSAHVDNLKK